MKRLGEILIEHGSINQKQLMDALEQQKATKGKLIGEILIELGYVTEEDIVVALATQFNVPYLPIGNFTLNPEVEQMISRELIEKYLCIPLDRIGNLLTVVMADPTNETGIKEIESVTKCKIQAFVASVSEIVGAIEEHFNIKIKSSQKPGEQISKVSFRSAVQNKTQGNT
jgi:type IV pilus assembly protein PilB